MQTNLAPLSSPGNPQTVDGLGDLLGILLGTGGSSAAWMLVVALCIAIVIVATGYAIRIGQNRS